MLRDALRYIAVSSLAALYDATGQMEGLKQPHIQFLYLHDVAEEEQDCFRTLLKRLSVTHHFLNYSAAGEKVFSGDIDRPYIALSFDDGFKSCTDIARILNELDITACFFVCPSVVGEANEERLTEFCANRLHMPPTAFLSWDDVELLLRQGHEIGSHTMFHYNLSLLSEQRVRDDVGGSFDSLTQRVGAVKHFAWPYGRFSHFSALAARAVFDAGFVSCASAERGCHVDSRPALSFERCIRRDKVIAGWPMSHIRYFMANNYNTAALHHGGWPSGWLEVIQGK